MKPKYTIVNLNFLGGKKLPRITPKDIIGNDNISLRFTDEDLYQRAYDDPDLMDNYIIGPKGGVNWRRCDEALPPKPEPPPNDVISQLFPLTDLIVQIMQDLKGLLKK